MRRMQKPEEEADEDDEEVILSSFGKGFELG